MKLLIVIPAYNEEANIKTTVSKLRERCPQYDYVVVNDGSRDGTTAICRKEGFNLVDLPINIGLAGAVQTGMQYGYLQDYDAVLQYDGDGQHEPEYIEALCDAMIKDNADIVIGSRFIEEKKPFTPRMMGSTLIQFLLRLVSGVKLTDPTSGMRLFGKKLIKEFAQNMNYGPEPDTLAYLMRSGAKVVEVPVKMSDRLEGESYLNFTRSIRYMMHMCVSMLIIVWFRRRPGV